MEAQSLVLLDGLFCSKLGSVRGQTWGTADINACKGKAELRPFLKWQPGTQLA